MDATWPTKKQLTKMELLWSVKELNQKWDWMNFIKMVQ